MHNLRVQEGDNQCRFLLKKVKIDIKISVPYALKSCHSPRLYMYKMYIYAIIKYHIVNVTMSRKGGGNSNHLCMGKSLFQSIYSTLIMLYQVITTCTQYAETL